MWDFPLSVTIDGEEFEKINALCRVLEKEYKSDGDFKENYIDIFKASLKLLTLAS